MAPNPVEILARKDAIKASCNLTPLSLGDADLYLRFYPLLNLFCVAQGLLKGKPRPEGTGITNDRYIHSD